MRTMMLAGGVSQALVSTAGGPGRRHHRDGFFSYFRGRVQHLISILESEGTLLTQELILLSRRHRVNSLGRPPMNLRRRINQEPIQLQLAPMIDVVMFLLCFFC